MPLVLAAPALVVAALFAVLFMLAWSQWRNTIVHSLSISLPVVGNVIAGLVADGLDAAYETLVIIFDNVVNPAINLILGPIAAVENTFGVIRDTLDVYAAAIGQLALVTVPTAIQTGVDLTTHDLQVVIATADDYALGLFFNAQFLFNAEVQTFAQPLEVELAIHAHTLDAILSGLITTGVDPAQVTNLATAAAQSVVGAALAPFEGLIDTSYGQATSYAAGLFGQAEQDIADALARAEAYATTAVSNVVGLSVTDIDQAIAGALGGIYTDIDTAVSETVGVIGTGDADVLAGLRQIPVGQIASLAGVATLAGATTLTLARYLRDCGIPNCQNLSQFGNELQDLLSVVGDASFLALLVELIHNPSAAAATINDTFGSVISDATSTAKSLLGV